MQLMELSIPKDLKNITRVKRLMEFTFQEFSKRP